MLRTGRNNGYTLLELIVALGIISLMATAIPMLVEGYLPHVALNAAVGQLKGDLVQMRNEAKGNGLPAGIQAGDNPNTYLLLPSGQTRALNSSLTVGLGPEPGYSSDTENQAFSILFFPQGGSTGGVIEITNGNHSKTLEIDWMTGTVEDGADG